MSSHEIQGLTRFLQIAIEIARAEISNGMDVIINKYSDSCMIKNIPWSPYQRVENILKICFRNAHIDEFEKIQKKLIINYDHKNKNKKKNIQITKSAGYFFLLYLPKVEHGASSFTDNLNGIDYVNIIANTQAGIIIKNMI